MNFRLRLNMSTEKLLCESHFLCKSFNASRASLLTAVLAKGRHFSSYSSIAHVMVTFGQEMSYGDGRNVSGSDGHGHGIDIPRACG